MKELTISASRSCRVLIGSGLLSRAGELALPLIEGRRALIACGERVFALYGERLRESLELSGFSVWFCVYPSGEAYKTPETMLLIVKALAEAGFDRSDAVFALGGGVTGDMAGLAAALYRRGIACVLLPTTLLAAADASVGGKTAVDLPQGKNLLGCFAQPRLVLCDTDCFRTLPPETFAEGWAEIVKCAFLRPELLPLLEEPEPRLEEILAACVELNSELVASDEFDTGVRRLLNFGHTVGHAIERCSGWEIPHGHAVAAGMAILTRGCAAKGLCPPETAARLESLLKRFSLPLSCDFTEGELLAAARADKKTRGRRITLVLPDESGRPGLRDMSFEELGELIALGL